MKKLSVNPLALDKETIAQLDEQQLQDITGGTADLTDTSGGGHSTGCGSGSSTCAIEEN
jgi:hypothetical protein